MSLDQRLSVPPPRTAMPRAVADDEFEALVVLADALLGPNERAAAPSAQESFAATLEVALATRCDVFDDVMSLAAEAQRQPDPAAWLRMLHDTRAEEFVALSSVLGGAYLMVPAVRQAIGYPGQRRDPAGLEEAVDQISDGILDPVLERGHFFVPTPKVP